MKKGACDRGEATAGVRALRRIVDVDFFGGSSADGAPPLPSARMGQQINTARNASPNPRYFSFACTGGDLPDEHHHDAEELNYIATTRAFSMQIKIRSHRNRCNLLKLNNTQFVTVVL